MTTMKLYEAVEALATVNNWIEEHADEILLNKGELSPELAELLDQAEGSFKDKVERVALKVRELKSEALAVKAEADRLSQRAKTATNAADSLTDYLHRSLTAAGETKVAGTLVTVAIQKSPASLSGMATQEALRELCAVSPQLVTLVPSSFVLNAKAVLGQSEVGQVIVEGVTVTQGTHIRIR